jgi:hypothetical protein
MLQSNSDSCALSEMHKAEDLADPVACGKNCWIPRTNIKPDFVVLEYSQEFSGANFS